MTTLELPRHRASRLGARLWQLSLAYPALCVGALYGTWCLAWFSLGHPARPSLDDPKDLGLLVQVPYETTMVILVLAPWALLVGPAVAFVTGVHSARRRAGGVIHRGRECASGLLGLALLGLVWSAAITFLVADPWEAANWLFD